MDSTTPLPLAAPLTLVPCIRGSLQLPCQPYNMWKGEALQTPFGASPCVVASKNSLARKTGSGGRGAASVCSQQESTPVSGARTCRQGSITFRIAGLALKHRFSPSGRCFRSTDLKHLPLLNGGSIVHAKEILKHATPEDPTGLKWLETKTVEPDSLSNFWGYANAEAQALGNEV